MGNPEESPSPDEEMLENNEQNGEGPTADDVALEEVQESPLEHNADATNADPETSELPEEPHEEDSVEIMLRNYRLPATMEPDALDLLKGMNFKMWSVDSMESIPSIEELVEEVAEEVPEVAAAVQQIKEIDELPEQHSEVEVAEDAEVVVDEAKGEEEEESDISIKSVDLVYKKEEKVVLKEFVEEVKEEDPMVKFLELCTKYGIDRVLKDVADKVVDTCEFIDEDEILRGKLDPNKLLQCLHERYSLLQIQQRKRFLLNKKVADYYRRKKNLRAIADDPPDHFLNEIKRYRDSLHNLDELKNKESKTLALVEHKTASLNQHLDKMNEILQEKVDELNKHIREVGIATHYKKNSQLINEKLVDYFIRKMNGMRNEISKVRLHIIQQQHSIGVLQERSRKLEELGNGLKMVEYEQLQTETIALAEKIEERNNELSKLRFRCNTDTHIIAHIKEKQEMLAHKILLEQQSLIQLIEQQSACREYVHDLKLQRDSLRKQYNELSYKCGLLDKPQLLYDYDVTQDEIQAVGDEVVALKNEKASLLKRIEKYEEMIRRS